MNAEKKLHYAIIGAGIGGAYCAWRLKEAHPSKDIVLFELSNRVGGRLLTRELFGTKIELGGMRYTKDHLMFSTLVDKLGLGREDFPMGYFNTNHNNFDNDAAGKNNFAYFRGQQVRIRDLEVSSKLPFKVNSSETDKTPDQLQAQVMKVLVPGAPDLSPAEWFSSVVFGTELWKYGFWNLLYRVLSPEAYQFLKYGSGYDTNVSNGNAVALLPTGEDYSPDKNQYFTVKQGMMRVPERLCEEFVKLKGELVLNRRLDSIERLPGSKVYGLKFAVTKTEGENEEKTEDTGAEPEYWEADNVILAVPKIALERINWAPMKTDPFLRSNLDSVLIQPAVKIFLAYDYAWWKAFGIFRGRSITDLPIRQTYYLSDLEDLKKENPFKIARDKPGVLMASYSDIESVPFWEGLGDNATGFAVGPSGYRASKLMVKEAHQQVMDIHNQYELPEPQGAAYQDWGKWPSGGGWHCWKPGFKYDVLVEKMRHPVPDENVFICGETYSIEQGWAEGALKTAERLLCEDLDKEDRLGYLSVPIIKASGFRAVGAEGSQNSIQSIEELTRTDSKHRLFLR